MITRIPTLSTQSILHKNMSTASRTKRTLQNSATSLFMLLFQIVIGFYSRKIFLDKLGDELLGINTTIGDMLSFLNLAELGIGAAMSTSLYKPLHDRDEETICEILSVQGYLYKRIAILLCLFSIPILILIPYFFHNTQNGLLYIYIAYIVFLWGSLSSYFWNYRQVLIHADQKAYKLTIRTSITRYIKIFSQIFFLQIVDLGIWGWITIEFIGSTANIFIINYIMKNEYPWLHKTNKHYKQLLDKYHHLIIKIKQLFIHKISSFVLDHTAPIIIYYYVSLSMVTYYGNYMIIIGYSATLLNSIFGGMGASIGNLVAENNRTHTMDVFYELFTARIWISAIACFAIYIFTGPFITIWIGSKYVLSDTTLILLIIGLFIRLTRSVIESFKHVFQLFGDVWAAIVEAILNLSGSIIFGSIWGLNGILLGINTSLIIIVLIWKPYYTFKKGFNEPCIMYYIKYVYHIALLIICGWASIYIVGFINFSKTNYPELFIYLVSTVFIYSIISFFLFFISFNGMRDFTKRTIKILHKIRHKNNYII